MDSTSNTEGRRMNDEEDPPYMNPNLKNDLSQMNISHLSNNEVANSNNTPG
jgi:hypothetical protein